jgi:isoaspartyl peptidase/L-asparaginase-like protein (Ntn-hydrolase superfamily)
MPTVISTWKFSFAAAQTAWELLRAGRPALDAVEEGVVVCEDDPQVQSVGYGGLPDASGHVTLDASIMDHDGRCGAVACLSRCRNPIRVARRMMERTPHVLLVGQGADDFARRQGFPETDLLTPAAAEKFATWKRDHSTAPPSHDTIGLLALDASGRLAGACSTSGTAFKLPGRVGDSPIIGAGLYVDGRVGAASATGLGEEALRIAGSAMVVEQMARGDEPGQAITSVFQRIRTKNIDLSFIALRADGVVAGLSLRAATRFQYVVAQGSDIRVIDADTL